MSALALSFQNTQFDVIDHSGQPWLKSPQIAVALGYADQSSINRIYARNADEFTDTMTASVKLTDPNGDMQETRIFSLRGCHLLAMFARTAVAKEFRKWVLDVLEKHTQPATRYGLVELPEPPTKLAYSGKLTLEQQDVIKALVKERAESLPKDMQAGATIRCWSAIKKKFGCTYKEVPAENFVNIISLISRLPLEGELIDEPNQTTLPGFQALAEANKTLNTYLDQSQAMMQAAGITPPALPVPDGDLATGLVASMLWQNRWMVWFDPATMQPKMTLIPQDAQVMTPEQWKENMVKYRGYIVVKKAEVAAKLMA